MSVRLKPNVIASSTVTFDPAKTAQTMPSQQAQEKALSPKERVSQFLKLMNSSGLFPKEQIENWARQSLEVYFNDLTEETAKLEAAKVFSYLLIDLIDPALGSSNDADSLDVALDIRDAFCELLKTLLPKNADLDKFIAERKENDRKIQMYLKKKKIEAQVTEQSKQYLYAAGNQLNQKNLTTFESMKSSLLKINTERDKAVSLAQEALQTCDVQLHQVSDTLCDHLDKAKSVSQQMQSLKTTFEQQRHETFILAKEIKKI